ncbi:MAG: site-specific DNA-methyltransferase [Planctomycetaceae bacterium]|nr:site-specific DNA-methyltransferase [Planctomycetaceae bacterium]
MNTKTIGTRRPPGQIRDAIVEVLQECGGEATIAEIRAAVAFRVGGRLSPSSVRSYLRLNTPRTFLRTRSGRYRLAADEFNVSRFENHAPRFAPAFSYGRARFYQADCLEWFASQPPCSLHAVVTDPPYGLVEYTPTEQAKLRSGKGGIWRIPPSFDGHQRAPLPRFTVLERSDLLELRSFFTKWGRAIFPVLVPGAHVAIASNPLLSHWVAGAMTDAGYERRGEIIRLVMTMRGGDRPKNAHIEFSDVTVMPRSMFEPWLLFRKPLEGRVQDNLRKWKTGGLRRPSADKPFADVVASSPTRPREKRLAPHPSLKPQAFLRKITRAVLPLGEGIVVDPFAGSGSTIAAAEAVGYESVGIEIDPYFIAMARTAIPKLRHFHPSSDASR